MVALKTLITGALPGGSPSMAAALEAVLPPFREALRGASLPGRISTACFWCQSSGAGQVEVLVLDDGRPQDHETLVVRTPLAFRSLATADQQWIAADVAHAGLTRLATTLQWDPAGTADLLDAARRRAVAGLPPRVDELPVHARGAGGNAPDQAHQLMHVGGGPALASTAAYDEAIATLLSRLGRAEWQEWWAHSAVPLGEIYVWHDGHTPGVRVRVGKKVTAAITRPPWSIDHGQPGIQAHQDVTALVERLRRRLDLPPPPELPSPPPVRNRVTVSNPGPTATLPDLASPQIPELHVRELEALMHVLLPRHQAGDDSH